MNVHFSIGLNNAFYLYTKYCTSKGLGYTAFYNKRMPYQIA